MKLPNWAWFLLFLIVTVWAVRRLESGRRNGNGNGDMPIDVIPAIATEAELAELMEREQFADPTLRTLPVYGPVPIDEPV